jgi:hypothetical protein
LSPPENKEKYIVSCFSEIYLSRFRFVLFKVKERKRKNQKRKENKKKGKEKRKKRKGGKAGE